MQQEDHEPEPEVVSAAAMPQQPAKIAATRLRGHTAAVLALAIDPHRPYAHRKFDLHGFSHNSRSSNLQPLHTPCMLRLQFIG